MAERALTRAMVAQMETLRALSERTKEIGTEGWTALADIVQVAETWERASTAYLAQLAKAEPEAGPWEPRVGRTLPHNGALVLAHKLHKPKVGSMAGWWVLCLTTVAGQPFATWFVNNENAKVWHGHQFSNLLDAVQDWRGRADII